MTNEQVLNPDVGSHLRCPDCRADIAVGENALPAQTMPKSCGACGRVIDISDGILMALPADMERALHANATYYDELSGDEANLLAKRTQSRNHWIKFDTVSRSLGLKDQSQPHLVLEIGTGYGSHADSVRKAGHNYVGLDISKGLLETARRRFPSLQCSTLVSADATRMPFQDDLFDACFCVATLHHLPEPGGGIREMIRTLKPGGRFCFLEPTRFYPTTLLQYFRHPDFEVSVMKMTAGNLQKWTAEAGARDIRVGRCVYTPNGPRFLQPTWKLMDRVLAATPPLSYLSVMFYVYGSK